MVFKLFSQLNIQNSKIFLYLHMYDASKTKTKNKTDRTITLIKYRVIFSIFIYKLVVNLNSKIITDST